MSSLGFLHEIRDILGFALAGIFVFLVTRFRTRIVTFIMKIASEKTTLPWGTFHGGYGKINQLITELRIELHADRCMVWQFHNGGHFLPYSSAWKASATYEICGQGVAYTSSQFKEVLLSNVWDAVRFWCEGLQEKDSVFVREIVVDNQRHRIPRLLIFSVEHLPESYYKASLTNSGTEYVLITPIYSKPSPDLEPENLVGLLLIEWMTGSLVQDNPEVDFTEALTKAQIISLALMFPKKNLHEV